RPVLRRRADVGPRHPHLGSGVLALVAGAPVGRRFLRSVRDRGDGADLLAPGPDPRLDRGGDRAVRHHRVHGRRRARHPAPPVLRRHADRGGRAGRQLLRAGSGAAGLHRLRGLPHLEAGQGHPVDGALQVADPVLHLGLVLEPRRRRPVRVPDRPAAVAVLHAGPEPDPAARPHRPVRRVRHARHRAGAVLHARPARADAVEHRRAEGVVLGAQHRPGADGGADPAAAGHDAVARRDRARLLVRALGRVHADADRGHAGVDARARRHGVQHRRPRPGLVRAAPVDRAEARYQPGRGYREGMMDLKELPLAAAPHRLMFAVGAANVLLAMLWWAAWLVATRWQLAGMPQPDVYAGWIHAIVMQYQVLAPFMFGFLITVFPRWMGLNPITKWHYVPVGVGLFGGQLLTLAGALGPQHLLHLGAVFTIAGWATGLFYLLRWLWQDAGRTWHSVSCGGGLLLGLAGFLCYAVYLHTGDARLMFAAIKIGTWGLLLPVYVT